MLCLANECLPFQQTEPYSGRSPGGKGTRCHGQQHSYGEVTLLRCSLGPSPTQFAGQGLINAKTVFIHGELI